MDPPPKRRRSQTEIVEIHYHEERENPIVMVFRLLFRFAKLAIVLAIALFVFGVVLAIVASWNSPREVQPVAEVKAAPAAPVETPDQAAARMRREAGERALALRRIEEQKARAVADAARLAEEEKAEAAKNENDRRNIEFNIALNLERSDLTDQALLNYRKLIKEHPGAPQAKSAAERIKFIEKRRSN